MEEQKIKQYIEEVVTNMPNDWLRLTTHRLDIYDESQAKFQFLEQFEKMYQNGNANADALSELPTAYDYIRLGHPLSSVLEWSLAKLTGLKVGNVISFQSDITPILAVLRKNLFDQKETLITYSGDLPQSFDSDSIKSIYGYSFKLEKVVNPSAVPTFDGSTIYVTTQDDLFDVSLNENIDFYLGIQPHFGSVILVNENNENYISEIQHVRRRETIAMTPQNCFATLQGFLGKTTTITGNADTNRIKVENTIREITGVNTRPLIASSGLSTQYAIVMGLIDHAIENHPGKDIRIVIPPNCYGGTNDQGRRVAACLSNVSVMDLPVDGDHDMVESIDTVLAQIANEDAVPLIIAEIPTNPRVEVPDLIKLRDVLSKDRQTTAGTTAIDPIFILDQTFCPNVHFLGDSEMLAAVRTIAYVSGSKFPSGGRCTAGYLTANTRAAGLMGKIEKHLTLCDNAATPLQLEILAEQMPSMNQRIADAYANTRAFVNYIQETLPAAKINFVSEELAAQTFTPSVFSLDLPTQGTTHEEREEHKRALNLKLINMMIEAIPSESKYCVSYGQLKGCYWTIPATSTQGTTKEEDKDYIARVALSGNMDLQKHMDVFKNFVDSLALAEA
jgi:cystathionine beta-lyase/cystathionine gamma-synthase